MQDAVIVSRGQSLGTGGFVKLRFTCLPVFTTDGVDGCSVWQANFGVTLTW